MIYADSDFFLALLKRDDWLKQNAKRIYQKYKGQIWTSGVTLIEMLLICEEYELDPERVIVDILEIAEIRGIDVNKVLLAAHFMKEENLNVFDSMHASFCGEDVIISSDKAFDRIGLKRIKLEGRV